MRLMDRASVARIRPRLPDKGLYIVGVLILVFGFYVLYPTALILINSFNIAAIGDPAQYSLDNWRVAFTDPDIMVSIRNTFMIYGLYTIIAFPLAVAIAWILARTNIVWSHGWEFMFWVSYMIPGMATTIGWIFLIDPRLGMLNKAIGNISFMGDFGFNIYSVEGIVWAHLMSNAISGKVMLLTPAFRNMDAALEEAGTVSGASKIRVMLAVTLPVMVPILSLVLLLNIVRVFSSFETEQLLGIPFGFFVYSTQIHHFMRVVFPAQVGQATALASIVLVIIAAILPLQRWLLQRKRYTTITGNFKPGLIHLGGAQPFILAAMAFLVALLTVVPLATLLGGSFMTRLGFFQAIPPFTLDHWRAVSTDDLFAISFRTTLLLSLTTAIVSPLLFSMVAFVLVRTRWRGRAVLDSIFWISAAIPGMLTGLGLLWMFLGIPILVPLYGTMFGLLLVVLMQGKLSSTQLSKAAILQVGADIEEAARVSGAGWLYTYFRIWLPLLMPTLILIGTINFVLAAGATSSIILLASRDTMTLSLLVLQYMRDPGSKELEQAGIVSLVMMAMTTVVALTARGFGLRIGLRHSYGNRNKQRQAVPEQGLGGDTASVAEQHPGGA